MSEWRIGRGWTDAELESMLQALEGVPRNYEERPEDLVSGNGWQRYSSEAVIARTTAGPPSPGGPFERAAEAVSRYEFSDPRIVVAHFDPDGPLLGRRILLEIKAARLLRFLGGVVVGAVREERGDDASVFGFRYDTLEGHIEKGGEWFLVTKDHESGAIRFRIEALWRPGQFPNWWSRLGFTLVGKRYQELWHRRAHHILSSLVFQPPEAGLERGEGRIAHSNPEVTFKRHIIENA